MRASIVTVLLFFATSCATSAQLAERTGRVTAELTRLRAAARVQRTDPNAGLVAETHDVVDRWLTEAERLSTGEDPNLDRASLLATAIDAKLSAASAKIARTQAEAQADAVRVAFARDRRAVHELEASLNQNLKEDF